MTSQSPKLTGEVSPYLLMALRDAPKRLADPPRAEGEPKKEPDHVVKPAEQPERLRDVPPLARPGPKL